VKSSRENPGRANNLGLICCRLVRQWRIAEFETAVRLRPMTADTKGNWEQRICKWQTSTRISEFEAALKISPRMQPCTRLGLALKLKDKLPEAWRLAKGRRLDLGKRMCITLGVSFGKQGDFAAARRTPRTIHANRTMRAYYTLESAESKGRIQDSVTALREAIRCAGILRRP